MTELPPFCSESIEIKNFSSIVLKLKDGTFFPVTSSNRVRFVYVGKMMFLHIQRGKDYVLIPVNSIIRIEVTV